MPLLLALLLALEQSYGPYTRPVNGGDAAVAVAAVRGRALLTWSEENRIRTGMLDPLGRLSAEIQTLPAPTGRSVAVAPTAASDGAAFFVAWIELEAGLQRTMGMLVAADGMPAGEPRQYGKATAIASNNFVVRIVWDGAAYWLWTGDKVFTLDRGGNVLATENAAMPSGVAAADGVVATSSSRIALQRCGFSWCSWESLVTWTRGKKSDSLQIDTLSGPYNTNIRSRLPTPPTAIAPVRDRFLLAWPVDGIVYFFIPGDGGSRVSASADDSVRPGLACDDTQCVIAYGRSKDVHAFTFPIDRFFGPELLTIAATERNERAPQVYTLGEGRFLVLYRSDGVDGARLNWRILRPDPPRRRAMR
jgi:hypothetical protein